MLFLVDQNYTLSYQDILNHINSSDFYKNCFIYQDLKSFLLNWIMALVNEKDIALMDSDISQKEIEDNQLIVNEIIEIENPRKINSVIELVNVIDHSTSEITLFTSGTTGFTR